MNSKGQVTIPAAWRAKHGLHAGRARVVDDEGVLRIVRSAGASSRGQRLVEHMRGRAGTAMTTDQLLTLLLGE